MKLKINLLLIFLFLTTNGASAQPRYKQPFNPFFACRVDFESAKYFFYGEIVSVESLEGVNVDKRMTQYKALVRIEKSLKGAMLPEITLYFDHAASGQRYSPGDKYLFHANDGLLDKQKVYLTEIVSRPMTDYSPAAIAEVLANIEAVRGVKTDDSIEGLIYEALLRVRDVSIKKEDADRLVYDFQNSKPLADILLEATSEADGKVYRARSDADGRFKIDGVAAGAYKIKLYLPEDKEQTEPFIYSAGDMPCSRKWNFRVMPKSPPPGIDNPL